MRVGQAFSKVLDPSKPPLFSDIGDLGLQPEEAWHRDCLPPTLKQSKPAAVQPQPAERTEYVPMKLILHAHCQSNSTTLRFEKLFNIRKPCHVHSCS